MFKFRNTLRKIYLDIFSIFSVPKNGVHILNGHFIAQYSEKKEIFFDLLNALSQSVDFINIQDASDLILTKKIPLKQKLVAFTFDDGFEECFTKIKPSLDYFGIKAAFFINPNFINGNDMYIENFLNNVVFLNGFKPPMGWDQIIELKNEGHIIGAHTMDHLRLDIQDKEKLEYQIKQCKFYIENKLGNKCEYFAYPYGQLQDISDEAIKMADDNFKYNFTQSNYRKYFSFDGKFINRRHFEGIWPVQHVKYFLKTKS